MISWTFSCSVFSVQSSSQSWEIQSRALIPWLLSLLKTTVCVLPLMADNCNHVDLLFCGAALESSFAETRFCAPEIKLSSIKINAIRKKWTLFWFDFILNYSLQYQGTVGGSLNLFMFLTVLDLCCWWLKLCCFCSFFQEVQQYCYDVWMYQCDKGLVSQWLIPFLHRLVTLITKQQYQMPKPAHTSIVIITWPSNPH